MVVTTRRKRSCSASEATPGTPRVTKTRKQDDDDTDSSSNKGAGSETPTTTRRTRRVTDTAATTTPSTSTCTKDSNSKVETSIKSGSKHVERESEGNVTTPRRTRRVTDTSINTTNTITKPGDIDCKTPRKGLRSSDTSSDTADSTDKTTTTRRTRRNTDPTSSTPNTKGKTNTKHQQTPRKGNRSDETTDSASENIDSSDVEDVKERKGRIGTPTPHTSRRRTVSSTTPSLSTPVRRSRRLSGSGVEDSSSQETPTKKSTQHTPKKSFSIAKLLSLEGTPKEETSKNSKVLPVIEEDDDDDDAKEESPSKSKRRRHGPEEFQMEYRKFTEATDSEAKSSEDSVDDNNKEVMSDASESQRDESKSAKGDAKEGRDNEESHKSSSEAKNEVQKNVATQEPKIKSPGKDLKKMDVEQSTEEDAESKTNNINTEKSTEVIQACKENNAPQKTDENGNNGIVSAQDGLFATTRTDKDPKANTDLEKKLEHIRNIPKGLPISGRWWKAEKQRFRSTNKDATGKKSWAKKMQLKQWRGEVLAKSAAIEAEKQKKKEDLKERQRINKIRREENAKKSEVVQLIKDPTKIKKMKRKQLRYLQMRDTTTMQ